MEKIKKAIYKYMKMLNKKEAKKYNWNNLTLKLQNDLSYNYVENLNINNINYILKTNNKILYFM